MEEKNELSELGKKATDAKAKLDAILKRSDETTEAVQKFLEECHSSADASHN